jgi:hypothetical protein
MTDLREQAELEAVRLQSAGHFAMRQQGEWVTDSAGAEFILGKKPGYMRNLRLKNKAPLHIVIGEESPSSHKHYIVTVILGMMRVQNKFDYFQKAS